MAVKWRRSSQGAVLTFNLEGPRPFCHWFLICTQRPVADWFPRPNLHINSKWLLCFWVDPGLKLYAHVRISWSIIGWPYRAKVNISGLRQLQNETQWFLLFIFQGAETRSWMVPEKKRTSPKLHSPCFLLRFYSFGYIKGVALMVITQNIITINKPFLITSNGERLMW